MTSPEKHLKNRLMLRDMALFAMFGALMFTSKVMLDFLPNVHLVGAFIAVFTVTYRFRALIPIYLYVMLTGLFYGFNAWWIPYLYVWTVLWAAVMLIPKSFSKKATAVTAHILAVLHGLAFGTLWAPSQAILFGLDLSGTVKWIIAGLPYDALHAAGNLVAGFLIYPLMNLLEKLNKQNTN